MSDRECPTLPSDEECPTRRRNPTEPLAIADGQTGNHLTTIPEVEMLSRAVSGGDLPRGSKTHPPERKRRCALRTSTPRGERSASARWLNVGSLYSGDDEAQLCADTLADLEAAHGPMVERLVPPFETAAGWRETRQRRKEVGS